MENSKQKTPPPHCFEREINYEMCKLIDQKHIFVIIEYSKMLWTQQK